MTPPRSSRHNLHPERAVAVVATLGGIAVAGAWLAGRARRFVVADRSMEPRLQEGDGLIAWRSRRARPGQLRCVEHPLRPGFWLVKRVATVVSEDLMDVRSDNAQVTTVDSQQFGPVPIEGSWRVVVRLPRRLM